MQKSANRLPFTDEHKRLISLAETHDMAAHDAFSDALHEIRTSPVIRGEYVVDTLRFLELGDTKISRYVRESFEVNYRIIGEFEKPFFTDFEDNIRHVLNALNDLGIASLTAAGADRVVAVSVSENAEKLKSKGDILRAAKRMGDEPVALTDDGIAMLEISLRAFKGVVHFHKLYERGRKVLIQALRDAAVQNRYPEEFYIV